MAHHGTPSPSGPAPVPDDALARRLEAHFEALHQRLDAMDRRLDQRVAEVRGKQEEELMLIKAMSCQMRGRVERDGPAAARAVTGAPTPAGASRR
jgi:hypothetical protein